MSKSDTDISIIEADACCSCGSCAPLKLIIYMFIKSDLSQIKWSAGPDLTHRKCDMNIVMIPFSNNHFLFTKRSTAMRDDRLNAHNLTDYTS